MNIGNNHSTAYFDGIRGIAVLIVWLSHTSARDQSLAEWLSFLGIGHIGVMLFFVLSGYLLSLPFGRDASFDVKSYLIRRFLRIAPLFYLVVVLVFIYQYVTGNQNLKYLYIDEGISSLIKHLIFFKGDGVFWTIPAEFTFYLMLPIFAIFLSKGTFLRYIAVFSIAFLYFSYHILVLIGIQGFESLKFVDIDKHSQYLDVFLVGLAFGMLSKESAVKDYYNRNKTFLDKSMLMFFILIMLLVFILVSENFLFFERPFFEFRYLSGFLALCFSLFLISAQLGNRYLIAIFSFKPFVFCGVVGYSWYLLHFLVIQYVSGFGFSAPIKFMVGTFLIAVISLVSYKIVEVPFIRIGKNYSKKRDRVYSHEKLS
ncbi:acyltransferase family protein [Neptuniibacter sp. QD48_55]|uniref:acyltransferase family protein n=1 Tax=Neptuniibacter sp. QD48_55 TaxID=3398212 RepID=UPI0039F54970